VDAIVLQYYTQLSNGEGDTTLAAQLYRDAIVTINGMQPALVKLEAGTPTADGVANLSGNADELLLAFWNGMQIGELSVREANYLFPDWREATTNDKPYNFVREGLSQKQLQLTPHLVSLIPKNSVQALVSYVPSDRDVLPDYMRMPVALMMLEAEYLRESPHQNVPLAAAFRSLATLLLAALAR
jgi:hypothetical protein